MSDARRWLIPSFGLGVALGLTEACFIVDPNHCSHSGVDCADGMVCDPCTPSAINKGCVMAGEEIDGLPDADGCQTVVSGATTAGPSEETASSTMTATEPPVSTTVDVDTTETPETSDTSTTTGPPVDCGDPDGTYDGECSGTAPFCVGGECVPCSTDDSQTMCPNDLVCDSSGACFVCNDDDDDACGGTTPYCDPQSHTCVPCTEHAHCGASACNLFTGACVAGNVITVGNTQDQPNLISAVAALGGGGGTIIVYEGTYNEAVTIGGGVVVAFLANQGSSPEWQRTMGAGGAPQLRVTGNSTVLIEEIEFRGNTSSVDPALRVDGASLWVDRSVVAQNLGVAMSAENGATLMLRNAFLSGVVDLPVLNAETASTVEIQYSTLGASLGDATAVLCDGGSTVTASDSIILSRGGGPGVVCPMFTADHSAGNGMLAGSDNAEVGAVVTTWFTSYNDGDFHLSASGQTTFMNVARWDDGDVVVDIDGMLRSSADGTAEHAGADLP